MITRTEQNLRRVAFASLVLGLLLAGNVHTRPARAQHPLDDLRSLWRSGAYLEVIPRLVEFRKGPYGRTSELDYMLATSACRIPSMRDLGYRRFKRILYDYTLTEKAWRLVVGEMNICGSTAAPVLVAFAGGRGQVGVSGKVFYWAGEGNAVSSSPAKVIRQIPYKEINARLFTAEDRDEAIRHVRRLVGRGFQVETHGSFLLASKSGHSSAELAAIGITLDKVLRFLVDAYDMNVPRALITVYLVPNTWELGRLAEDIHGIVVSSSTIAYTFQDDLSLVAVIPGRAIGSLLHELFHLMVRSNFGDVPAWMDEGLASLYEVSRLDGDRLLGAENWRRRALNELWHLRPTVGQVVSMDSREFDNAAAGYELTRQAANHAMARYFFLYLQERGALLPLYRAFRDRPLDDLSDDPRKEAVRLVEGTLRQLVKEIDRNFQAWFRTGPHQPLRRGTGLIEKYLPPRP